MGASFKRRDEALASLFGVSIALGTSGLALVILAGTTGSLVPRLKRV